MTKNLAELIHRMTFDKIPEEVLGKTKLCILDFIADAAAGVAAKLPSVEIMLDYLVRLGGAGEATIIGTMHKAPRAEAALMNSIAGEVLELGDGENRIIGHPGQSVIPAVLAVAEKIGASGRAILEAVLAGYESMIFVGDVTMPMAYDRGFSASASLGNFGAAAGAAKILGLDAKKIEDTLALAASASGFLRSWNLTGTMDKDLMVGEATRRGVLSAILAQSGYTGTSEILEGELGFCRAMTGGDFRSVQLQESHQYRIMDVYFKPYPSCRVTHSTIDAAQKLVRDYNVAADQIERVSIFTDSHGAQVAIPDPTTFVSVRFSNQYAAAVALLSGSVFTEQFSEEYARRPEVKALVSKTEVKVDPDMEDGWPDRYSARVEVLMRDGNKFSSQVDHPKGDIRNPMTPDDVIAKARSLMSATFSEERMEAIVRLVSNIEKMEEARDLMNLLRV